MTSRGVGPAARARQRGLELVGHDPVDFPFYGLDTSWVGPRYLHSFEVQDGRPLRALVLGHHSSDLQAWVLVTSVPRSARDQWWWRDDEAREAADSVVGELLELMRPRETYRSDGTGLAGYTRAQLEVGAELSVRWQTWPRAGLQVEGIALDGPLYRHARGWGLILLDLPEVVVRVLGAGVEPGDLALTRVTDPSPYRFDPTSRLRIDELDEHKRRHPEERLPTGYTNDLHPDHHDLARRGGVSLNGVQPADPTRPFLLRAADLDEQDR